jgi:hypothetical protein
MAQLASVIQGAIAQGLEPYKRPKEVFLSMSFPKLSNGKPDITALKKDLDLGNYLPQKSLTFKGITFHWVDLSAMDLPLSVLGTGESSRLL